MASTLSSILAATNKDKIPAGYVNYKYSDILNAFGAAAVVTADGTGGSLKNEVEGHAGVKDVQLKGTVDSNGFITEDSLKEVLITLQPKWGIPLLDSNENLYFATGDVDPTVEVSGEICLSGGQACPATLTDADRYTADEYNVGISFAIDVLGRKYVEHFYHDSQIGVTGTSGLKADLWDLMEKGQLFAEIAVVTGEGAGKVFHAKVINSEKTAGAGGNNLVYITSPILGITEYNGLFTPVLSNGASIGGDGAKFEFAGNGHDFFFGKINKFGGEKLKAKIQEGKTGSNVKVTFPKVVQARMRLWCSKETGVTAELPEDFYKTNYGDPKEGVYGVAGGAETTAVTAVSNTGVISGPAGQRIAMTAKKVMTFMSEQAYCYS